MTQSGQPRSPTARPLRFLLDEGFPPRPGAVPVASHVIEFAHPQDIAPHLCGRGIPDPLLILFAAQNGFDGFVTRNRWMLDEAEPLVALDSTNLVLVAWAKGDDDPVREWAQLLAYMSEIFRIAEGATPCVIVLPKPHLDPKQRRKHPRQVLGEIAPRQLGLSPKEARDAAVKAIRDQADAAGFPELAKDLKA